MHAISSPRETLKKLLVDCNEALHAWASTKPDLGLEGGWLFQQVEDSAILSMSANWKNRQAHEQCAARDEVAHISSLR